MFCLNRHRFFHHIITHMLFHQHHHLHRHHHVLLFNLFNFIVFFQRLKPIILHHQHRWLPPILDICLVFIIMDSYPFHVYARMRVCIFILVFFPPAILVCLFVVSFISAHLLLLFFFMCVLFMCMCDDDYFFLFLVWYREKDTRCHFG